MVDSIPTQAVLAGTVVTVTQAPLPSLLQYPIAGYPASDYIALITFAVFMVSAGISIWKKLRK